MKFYRSEGDFCSKTKTFAILETKKGRALFGVYAGYVSILFMIFTTKYRLIDSSSIDELLYTCSLDDITAAKFENFWNEEESLFEKIIHYRKNKAWRKWVNSLH